MASFIFLKGLFGTQEPCHIKDSQYNLESDIRGINNSGTEYDECLQSIIAKGNIIEGIEAKE